MSTQPEVSSPSQAAEPSRSFGARLNAYRLLWLLALSVFIADQITKYWIIHRLPLGSYGPGNSITIIPDFIYLVHVGNTGAAWSLLTGKSTLLAIVALGTLAAIFMFRRTLGLRDRLAQIAYCAAASWAIWWIAFNTSMSWIFSISISVPMPTPPLTWRIQASASAWLCICGIRCGPNRGNPWKSERIDSP
jgi:uncharacterized membrane protein